MLEYIKKTLLVGLGATVVTKDKLEQSLEDMVKQGKISATDAKKSIDKMVKESRKEFDKSSKEIQDYFKHLLDKANFACQKDFEKLEKRVNALEGKSKTTPKKPAVKKAAPKKQTSK